MFSHNRGCGPAIESNTMDKCVRDITRDHGKVIKFVMAEPDQKKKDALQHLYHTTKFFCDNWDGVSEDAKDRRFARQVVVVWTMLLNQPNGRKIMLVPMGGVTIPDATYYGYWCTIRGLTTAQLSAIEIYVEKMRVKSEVPDVTINAITATEGDDEGDNGETVTDVVEAIETEESMMVDGNTSSAVVAERENSVTMGNIAIEFNNGNISIDEMVTYVAEKTRQLLVDEEREKETGTDVDIATPARTRGNSDVSTVETDRETIVADVVNMSEPPIEPFRALNEGDVDANASVKIGPIDQTMEDSGLAPPTSDSQVLPAPNLTIDVLDNNDTFDDSSTDWFDHAAQDLINQQSTPVPGKIAIAVKDAFYVFITIECPRTVLNRTVECKIMKLDHFVKFVRAIVDGQSNSGWV